MRVGSVDVGGHLEDATNANRFVGGGHGIFVDSPPEGDLMPAPELLQKYADVHIGVGLGVEAGDRVATSATLQLPELTRVYGTGLDLRR
jgi:hypothetical protein